MAEIHGETKVPGRLTGRGKPRLEACAWRHGSIEFRITNDKDPAQWVNLEISLGDLMRWYRQMRTDENAEDPSLLKAPHQVADTPPDGLGAR